jgi:hypothetical protein
MIEVALFVHTPSSGKALSSVPSSNATRSSMADLSAHAFGELRRARRKPGPLVRPQRRGIRRTESLKRDLEILGDVLIELRELRIAADRLLDRSGLLSTIEGGGDLVLRLRCGTGSDHCCDDGSGDDTRVGDTKRPYVWSHDLKNCRTWAKRPLRT